MTFPVEVLVERSLVSLIMLVECGWPLDARWISGSFYLVMKLTIDFLPGKLLKCLCLKTQCKQTKARSCNHFQYSYFTMGLSEI